jgi:phosphatidylserine synthase
MILLISILSSLLLMSKVDYEKFPLISFKINKQNNRNLIKIILFLIILCVSVYYKDYDIILLLFISIYIFGNVLKFLINYKNEENPI